MKKLTRLITHLSIVCALALPFLPATSRAADLSAHDKQFLAGYEQIRAALAKDDLSAAQKAAAALADAGTAVAKSQSLDQARAAFAKLSDQAIHLAAGQSSLHVLHCDMANKDWVQTSVVVGNPYLGKEMAGCGELKK